MAQMYYHHRASSRAGTTSPVTESAFTSLNVDKQFKVEDVQEAYIDQKDRFVASFAQQNPTSYR
jgi:hypothetical protein